MVNLIPVSLLRILARLLKEEKRNLRRPPERGGIPGKRTGSTPGKAPTEKT